jgi:phosphatidylinositol-4,5-bisphosphate 3-kinase
MDRFWKECSLDFCMEAYQAICTGPQMGMIEVVLNSDTTANIQKSVMAVIKENTLAKWLREHNPSEESFNRSVDKFVLSCVGYCVATYVLGIGDRHNVSNNNSLFGYYCFSYYLYL